MCHRIFSSLTYKIALMPQKFSLSYGKRNTFESAIAEIIGAARRRNKERELGSWKRVPYRSGSYQKHNLQHT